MKLKIALVLVVSPLLLLSGCQGNQTSSLPTSSNGETSSVPGTSSVPSVPKVFTVTFLNYDNSLLLKVKVNAGETAVYSGAIPTKESDAQYSYVFESWDKPLDNVQNDYSVKALFTKTERVYRVTFYDGDGHVFGDVQNVKYGGAATMPSGTPTKASSERKTYYFKAWKEDFSLITHDLAVYSDFYEATRYYTVSFIVEGVKVGEKQVEFGEDAIYDEASWGTPSKASTDALTYTFSGWDHVLTSVAASFEARAVFASNERKYQVTFHYDGDDDTKTYVMAVGYGKAAVYPSEAAYAPFKAPSKNVQYAFKEWAGGDLTSIKADTEVSASFTSSERQYEVRFHTGGASDGILDTQVVTYSQNFKAPKGYTAEKDSGNTSKLFKAWVSEGSKTTCAESASVGASTLYNNGDVSAHDSTVDFYPTVTDSSYEITYEKVTPAGGETYAQVSGYSGDLGSFPEIKSSYDGVPVTTIKQAAFMGATSLYDVALPSSIKTVDSSAFINCANLRSVSLPSSLEAINGLAFENTYSLANVTLPKSLKSLGDYAFAYSGITSLAYEDETAMDFSWGNSAFRECNGLTSVTFVLPATSNAYNDVFEDCTTLKKVTIKGTGKKLPAGAFYHCGALESVTFEDEELTSIGSFAFADCYYLSSLQLPSTIQSIENMAFTNCTRLTEFEVPLSCTSIDNSVGLYYGEQNAMGGLSGVTAFKVASGNTAFVVGEDGVLYNAAKTRLVAYPAGRSGTGFSVPEGVTSIDAGAFYHANNLKVLTLPTTMTTLSSGMLSGSPVTSLLLSKPDQLTGAADNALAYCQLPSFTIPESITSLGLHFFMGDSALTSVSIPSSLTSLPTQSFDSCSNLTTVTFNGTNLTSINVNCFANCYRLAQISLPTSVTSIGESAFENCSALASCPIPSGVTSIGKRAFYCDALPSVAIPASCLSIGDAAFADLDDNKGTTKSITLAEGVKSLGASVFARTGISSIILPASLESVGTTLFFNCPNLSAIYLADTELNSAWSPSWSQGNGKDYAYYLYSATSNTDGHHWHYASDGVTPEIWSV